MAKNKAEINLHSCAPGSPTEAQELFLLSTNGEFASTPMGAQVMHLNLYVQGLLA